MPRPRPDVQLIDLWHAALLVEVGLSIKTNNRKLLQAQLYNARAAEGTVAMQDIAICIPATEDELWLVKREILEPTNA